LVLSACGFWVLLSVFWANLSSRFLHVGCLLVVDCCSDMLDTSSVLNGHSWICWFAASCGGAFEYFEILVSLVRISITCVHTVVILLRYV